jgi:hypothetical protein
MSRYITVVYELLVQRQKSDTPRPLGSLQTASSAQSCARLALKPLGHLTDHEFDQLMTGPLDHPRCVLG